MITFWLIAAGLIVAIAIGLVFVLPSLLRKLQKNPSLATQGVTATMLGGKVTAIVVSIAIPVLAVMLYLSYPHTSTSPLTQPSTAQNVKMPPEHAQVVEDMAARLEQNPNDGNGWSMLGHSYAVMGRYADAVMAYERALKLLPDDVQLLVDYADVLAVANDRNLRGKPLEMLNKAIKFDPKNVKALALLGTAAFHEEDYAGAVKYWEKMLKLLPPDDPFAKQMATGVTEARAKLASKKSPSPVAVQNNVSSAAGIAQIRGVLSLSPALASKAAPTDSVFLSAKEMSGSPMPIAVIRAQVKDLPLNFTLDDSLAMMPTMKLSDFQEVMLIAKVSKSGSTTTRAGDLKGEISSVRVGANGVKLMIDKIAP